MATYAENDDEVDISLCITVNSLGKTFQVPTTYDEISIADDSNLYGQAPWLDRDAVLTDGLVEEYVEEDDWLPYNIPIAAMNTWCCQNQFCCRDMNLVIIHNRTLAGFRAEFALKVMDGLNGINTWQVPAKEMETGIFLFRRYSERAYLTNLNAIPMATIEGWRGTTGV